MGSSMSLPEEALVSICDSLSTRDLINISLVSHLFKDIMVDDKLWKRKCRKKNWGGMVCSNEPIWKSWKQIYIQHVFLKKRKALTKNGGYFKSSFNKLASLKKLHVLLLGLNKSGKTVFLYKLKSNKIISSYPTIGSINEIIPLSEVEGIEFPRTLKVTEVGGLEPMRKVWSEYINDQKIDAIIYMVDCTDKNRLKDSKKELAKTIEGLERKVPILIMANKFDLPKSKPAHEIYQMLDLGELTKSKFSDKKEDKKNRGKGGLSWCVQSYSSFSGVGMVEGLSWLLRCFHPMPSDICFYCRDTTDIKECSNCKNNYCKGCYRVFKINVTNKEKKKKKVVCNNCFYCSAVEMK